MDTATILSGKKDRAKWSLKYSEALCEVTHWHGGKLIHFSKLSVLLRPCSLLELLMAWFSEVQRSNCNHVSQLIVAIWTSPDPLDDSKKGPWSLDSIYLSHKCTYKLL